MLGRELLFDLNAAAVAVHVAEAADIHEDVEAELLARAEGAPEFVMVATVADAALDDFIPAGLADILDFLANLAIAVVGVLVNESRREFVFERLGAAVFHHLFGAWPGKDPEPDET